MQSITVVGDFLYILSRLSIGRFSNNLCIPDAYLFMHRMERY
jgi:hypothetical protein